MVKFLKNGSLLALVEQPNWVYLQENGAYGLCDYENAQGVAINGIVYNLAGNLISENGEVDFKDIPSGEYMMQQDKVAAQNAANLDYLSMMTGYDLPMEEQAEAQAVSVGDIEGEAVYDDTVDDPAYVATEEEENANGGNEHSARFEKVKGYYDRCLWNRQMVMNAVGKWITAEEAEEILSECVRNKKWEPCYTSRLPQCIYGI